MSAILQPGDPAFNKILNAADNIEIQTLREQVSGLRPKEEIIDFPKCRLHHFVQQSDEHLVKIVCHFKRIGHQERDRISLLLQEWFISGQIPGEAYASDSPIYRDQWDFIIYHVPVRSSEFIHRAVIQQVERAYW